MDFSTPKKRSAAKAGVGEDAAPDEVEAPAEESKPAGKRRGRQAKRVKIEVAADDEDAAETSGQ